MGLRCRARPRGKPRFGRSLTLPGASPYLRRGSHPPAVRDLLQNVQTAGPFGFGAALNQLHLAARSSFRDNSQGLFYLIGCSGEPVGLHDRFLDPTSIFTVSRVVQRLI
jgi:hypothetical protein